jgi:hypothetical protein
MKVLEVATGKEHKIVIERVTEDDLKKLTVKRYFFKWKEEGQSSELYKLRLEADEDIKAVMALVHYPDEFRIEIKLLAASKENVINKKEKGKKQKEFGGLAGNMIAFACRLAVVHYGEKACVSLLPKTELKDHYIMEYGMADGGWQVFLESRPLLDLIAKYIL